MMKQKKKIPPTTHRVSIKTCPKINNMIRNQTIWNLSRYKNADIDKLSKRIKQLNCEWDTERAVELNSASLMVLSTIMGLKYSRCWFYLAGITGICLLNHALDGWCPSVPFLRKMGIRTSEEINIEKMVLKMMRGDFDQATSDVVEMYNSAVKQ